VPAVVNHPVGRADPDQRPGLHQMPDHIAHRRLGTGGAQVAQAYPDADFGEFGGLGHGARQ